MLISGGISPNAPHFRSQEWLAPYNIFDAWTLVGCALMPEVDRAELLRFSRLADQHGKAIRGGPLFHALSRRYQSWDDRVRRAAIMVDCVPATSWDVIHEAYPDAHRRHQPWGPDWMCRALDVAHQLAPHADLFLSEYRPQDPVRLQWVVQTCLALLDAGAPLHGLSIQLHSNLLSLQSRHLARIAETLRPLRSLKIHCVEVIAWDLLSDHVRRPPPVLAERLQARRYAEYKAFAAALGAEMFGPWFPWDGHYTHWRGLSGDFASPGIWRRDWSPKPAFEAIFRSVEIKIASHPLHVN